ncbi:MAG: hypothetical protein JSV79_01085 [Armatimonadota bacterium]|nr:MAG: hypothetical protein JSV79_01085 [Armatimonadota bacterium]
MPRPLPVSPNLEHLKNEAKALLKAHRRGDVSVCSALRQLRRCNSLSDEEILSTPVSLQEVQFVLARTYGFGGWGELKRHVLLSRTKDGFAGRVPSREDVMAFYLREDVSYVLWEIAQRRTLRFYYHTDDDIRKRGAKVRRISFHCMDSPEEMRGQATAAVRTAPSVPDSFFPFFGLATRPVTRPGERHRVVGWDMRFELDFELAASFRAVLPVVALLRHFGIPVLSKFSGHRSLHVIIPAEAFPAAMRTTPRQSEWMKAFDQIGRLICRLSPMLETSGIGCAKNLALTAPYSFHRYNGLLSIPIPFEEIWDFDPERSRHDLFEGVTWRPADFDSDGEGMVRMIAAAAEAETRPDSVLQLAEEIFAHEQWDRIVEAESPGDYRTDPVRAALTAGAIGYAWLARRAPAEHDLLDKVRQAVQALESPETKTPKVRGLASSAIGHSSGASLARKPTVEAMAVWIKEGLGGLFSHLERTASSRELVAPSAFAARMLWLAPEREEEVFSLLREAWEWPPEPFPKHLFYILALGEVRGHREESLRLFGRDEEGSSSLKAMLLQAGDWRVERRPDLTVALLALAFGAERVRTWAEAPDSGEAHSVVRAVFGPTTPPEGMTESGVVRKFRHAVAQVLGRVEVS